jgi:hypothetical protein
MVKKKIKRKKKNDNYRYMEPYGSLHTVLTWMALDGDQDIDWTDTGLIKQLWEWHGDKIMELWRKENRPGTRPKIWWHIHAKPEDFKIIRYEKYMTNSVAIYQGKQVPPPEGPEYIDEPIFESVSAFLNRKNLLEPWEVELAKKESWVLAHDTDNCLPFDYSTLEQYYNRIRKA